MAPRLKEPVLCLRKAAPDAVEGEMGAAPARGHSKREVTTADGVADVGLAGDPHEPRGGCNAGCRCL
eukprot:3464556-Heterocapsa_arctica.AAC.1